MKLTHDDDDDDDMYVVPQDIYPNAWCIANHMYRVN